MHGQPVRIVPTRQEHAPPVAVLLDAPDLRRHQVPHLLGRRVQPHPGQVAVRRRGDRPLHVGDRVRVLPRPEPPGRGHHLVHPVQPEGAPVVPVDVPGHQVPAAVGGDHPHRLDRPLRFRAAAVRVAEPHPHRVPAGAGEGDQQLGVDLHSRSGQRLGGAVHRPHLRAQSRRHDLVELGEHPQCRLTGTDDRPAGGQPQRHGRRDRFLVVQQQRRQPRARAELVPAADARGRVHRVAHRAQPFHVAAHAPVGDTQLGGELGRGPRRPPL